MKSSSPPHAIGPASAYSASSSPLERTASGRDELDQVGTTVEKRGPLQPSPSKAGRGHALGHCPLLARADDQRKVSAARGKRSHDEDSVANRPGDELDDLGDGGFAGGCVVDCVLEGV